MKNLLQRLQQAEVGRHISFHFKSIPGKSEYTYAETLAQLKDGEVQGNLVLWEPYQHYDHEDLLRRIEEQAESNHLLLESLAYEGFITINQETK